MAIGRAVAGQWAGLQGLELGFWKIFWRKEFGGERVFLLVAGKSSPLFYSTSWKRLPPKSLESTSADSREKKQKTTTNQLYIIGQTLEKTKEYDIDSYHLFLDFKDAYDSVNRKNFRKL
ncbi:hypothetical protein TNCV_3787691 [Trichonephila clavipes]|nr:hypothetical protein TNCV_3787691 [Trichonephila clavipes]